MNELHPSFNNTGSGITLQQIREAAGVLSSMNYQQGEYSEAIEHKKVLTLLIQQLDKVNFKEHAGLKDEDEKLMKKHLLIIAVEQVLLNAERNNWGICRKNDHIYLFNGAYWSLLDSAEMQCFLGEAAEVLGIDKFDARHYHFRDQLYKQFLATAYLPEPSPLKGTVLINLLNGTFEITPGLQHLRQPKREDFLTYQLPFKYDPVAKAPLFEKYLDQVQPDKDRQKILAEYIGYLFISSSTLKLEKTLLLYGSGANGKSVFFEVINALLGPENVSNFSLQSLTNESGYHRAKIGNKLLNYASEVNGKLETSIFKQMVSCEPLEARLPYGEPFILSDYAKLIFNCNELPHDVEQTDAFFRRFLIVAFDITIPEEKQDRELSKKIVQQELSGVFNWVLEGLQRLLKQKNFTESVAVREQLEQFRKQSDSVQLFLEEDSYVKDANWTVPLKDLFKDYRAYCSMCNYHSCSTKTFSGRLHSLGYRIERKNFGQAVYIKKKIHL